VIEEHGGDDIVDEINKAVSGKSDSLDLASSGSSKTEADKHWWGVKLTLSEEDTMLLAAGASGASGVATAISAPLAGIPAVGPALAACSTMIAGAMALNSAFIIGVDKGDGVHFDWSWFQISLLTMPAINYAAAASMMIPKSN